MPVDDAASTRSLPDQSRDEMHGYHTRSKGHQALVAQTRAMIAETRDAIALMDRIQRL